MSASEEQPQSTTVGVIGAGTMGSGVAHLFARGGYEVILVDRETGILDEALSLIRSDYRLARMMGVAGASGSLDDLLSRIKRSTEVDDLAAAAIVFENVTEDFEAKARVYESLDRVCEPGCIFGGDTSAIPIGRLASHTTRPERMIGTHFMNPVAIKDTVEVIPGPLTSDETVQTTVGLLESVGVESLIVGDSPGFVSNRVLMLTINEAVFLVHEGVAPPARVDEVFRKCFGHPMGPLATGDLIGWDTILNSLRVLQATLDDGKFAPCPLLVEMVDDGKLGRKAGQGFFKYMKEKRKG